MATAVPEVGKRSANTWQNAYQSTLSPTSDNVSYVRLDPKKPAENRGLAPHAILFLSRRHVQLPEIFLGRRAQLLRHVLRKQIGVGRGVG